MSAWTGTAMRELPARTAIRRVAKYGCVAMCVLHFCYFERFRKKGIPKQSTGEARIPGFHAQPDVSPPVARESLARASAPKWGWKPSMHHPLTQELGQYLIRYALPVRSRELAPEI
ncbi:protein of unknown function (plasmid) [Candidatus Methylocalor cossyra]|uniref:Integrase n=1 Tax=Candidatus Methylocalor cossyra TaxID=3108543 RepID=A0ABM9NN83_9GAMM